MRYTLPLIITHVLTATAFGFAPTIAPDIFEMIGSDYNNDRGVSPAPIVDLVTFLDGMTLASPQDPIPYVGTIPGDNGRDFVIETEFSLRWYREAGTGQLPIDVGHVIDLNRREYQVVGGEYHTYWTADPADDQYGKMQVRKCFPGENGCRSIDSVIGELEPTLWPYYLTSRVLDAAEENYIASLTVTRNPIEDTLNAHIGFRRNNDGTRPPVEYPAISIVPHADGIQTWLEFQAGGQLHQVTLDTSRPVSTWEEVDDWAMRRRNRSTPGDVLAEHWIDGMRYETHGGILLPEPSGASLMIMLLLACPWRRTRRCRTVV